MSDVDRTDLIFTALSTERRRVALSCLSEHHEMTLPDLADEVAQIEHDTSLDMISPESVKDLYLDLYHRHLPYLTAADLVEYSQSQDRVMITELGENVESEFVESARSLKL